jgi:hypothetical protein
MRERAADDVETIRARMEELGRQSGKIAIVGCKHCQANLLTCLKNGAKCLKPGHEDGE